MGLLSALNSLVTDLLEWLEHYPADDVDPAAVAAIRHSVVWVVQQLPAEQRHRLKTVGAVGAGQPVSAAGNVDRALLRVVAGLVVDVMWWLDTCSDDEVDPDVAVKLQESAVAAIDGLPHESRNRLLEVVGELATVERHAARRYELLAFPFAVGLAEDEPDLDAPSSREWVHPAARPSPHESS